jgi:hypothetical protein
MEAREFDAKDPVTEPNPASNPSDDRSAAILEDNADDPVLEELQSLISDLSVDAQIDLVALMWLGRDDQSADDWQSVRQQATDAHKEHTADYLCGTPLLASPMVFRHSATPASNLSASAFSHCSALRVLTDGFSMSPPCNLLMVAHLYQGSSGRHFSVAIDPNQ